jgi:hypothetical protein
MELKSSLPCAQEASTGSYPESDKSIHTNPSNLRSILILSTHLHLGLSSSLFPSGVPIKILYAIHFAQFVLYSLPV